MDLKADEEAMTKTNTDTAGESTTKPENVVVKDKWIIWMLIADNHPTLDVVRSIKDNGQPEMIFTFGPQAKELYMRCMNNEMIMVDYRKLHEAEDVFKRWLHKLS